MNIDSGSPNSPSQEDEDIVRRPPGHLHDFPVEFRWEATRRHPYYLLFWRQAQLYHQATATADNREEQLLRYIAFLMLGAIGVTGEPLPPDTDVKTIVDDSLDAAFLSGAVQPLTLRATAVMLLNVLPAAELAALGTMFMIAGSHEFRQSDDDDRGSLQRMHARGELAQLSSPALDSLPDAPLYYIHPNASQRTIVTDLESQIRRWKARRGIPEKRMHTNKLPTYIEVWDLREGWTGDGYNRDQELELHDIAARLKVPVSTVASRYQAAFEMITGHAFTPELWCKLLGPLKLSDLFPDAESAISAPTRRRFGSHVRRPTPDSVVSGSSGNASVVQQASVSRECREGLELMLDLKSFFEQDLTDEQIAEKVGCEAESVRRVRQTFDEYIQ